MTAKAGQIWIDPSDGELIKITKVDDSDLDCIVINNNANRMGRSFFNQSFYYFNRTYKLTESSTVDLILKAYE